MAVTPQPRVAAALLALLALAAAAAQPSHAVVEDALGLALGLESVAAEAYASIAALERGDREAALAHVDHALEKVSTLVLPRVPGGTAGSLEAALGELRGAVEAGSLEEARRAAEAVEDAASSLYEEVLPPQLSQGFIFNVMLATRLLDVAVNEYGEAFEGREVDVEEWEDAFYLAARAVDVYKARIAGLLPPDEAGELDTMLSRLTDSMSRGAGPEEVKQAYQSVKAELLELAGIEVVEGGVSAIIRDIKEMLDNLLEAYEAGRYDEALEIAATAYVEKYEAIESTIENVDPELNEEIEVMLREQLRELIESRAPAEDVRSLVVSIVDALERAERLVAGAGGEPREPKTVEGPEAPEAEGGQRGGGVPITWAAATAALLMVAVAEAIVIVRLKSGSKA